MVHCSSTALANSLNNLLQEETEVPTSWMTSITKLIPKSNKPTAKDLRPIALTNIFYKMMMAIVR